MVNFLFIKLGLLHLYANHSIFITDQGINGPIITTFINNFNIFAPYSSRIISRIKSTLTTAIEIVDMGLLAFYVGLKVTWDWEKWTIKLFQPGYIKKLFNRYGILKAKTAKVLFARYRLSSVKYIHIRNKQSKICG